MATEKSSKDVLAVSLLVLTALAALALSLTFIVGILDFDQGLYGSYNERLHLMWWEGGALLVFGLLYAFYRGLSGKNK